MSEWELGGVRSECCGLLLGTTVLLVIYAENVQSINFTVLSFAIFAIL